MHTKNILNRSRLTAIVQLIVATGAFLFIGWRIYEQATHHQLFELTSISWPYFGAALLLVLINWCTEALKWCQLIKPFQLLTFKNALISVFSGLSVSLLTPNRVGEFAGRILPLHPENRAKGVFATLIGSYSQVLAVAFFGFIAFLTTDQIPEVFLFLVTGKVFYITMGGLILIVSTLFYFLLPGFSLKVAKTRWSRFDEFIHAGTYYTNTRLFYILLLSIFRYLVFASQFYLILNFVGINLDLAAAFQQIALMYVAITIVPTIALTELGVRGTLALLFFTSIAPYPIQIVATTTIIWIINIAIPALLGWWLISRIKLNQV